MLPTPVWNTAGTGVPGDSGAAIVEDLSGELMGVAWGRNIYGGDQAARRITYFTSIFDILDDVYEKYPELGWANLPGGEVYNPQNPGWTSVNTLPPKTFDLGQETEFFDKKAHSRLSEVSASHELKSFDNRTVTTDIFEQQKGSPQSIAQMQSPTDTNAIFPSTAHHSPAAAQALQAPDVETTFLGNEDEDVIEIDSDEESAFSDVQSLSSQSSIQAIEVKALREAITSLFLMKSGVIDIFETGLRVHGIGGETMTARLRRSLRTMGGALGLDSKTLEQKTCSRRIKRDAEYIANAFRQRCDPEYARRQLGIDKTPISKEDEAKFIMEMWQRSRAPNAPIWQPQKSAEHDSDSEDDDQFDPEFEQELKRELDREISQKREEVENFILNSEHLVILKNRLQSLIVEDANIRGLQDKSTNGLHRDPEEQLADESEDLRSQFSGGAIEAPYERRSLPDFVESWFPQWFDFVWEPAPRPGTTRIRWTCVRFESNTAEMKMLT
ncbi:hypothetical protein CGCTS75_v011972 [Colletotrichum tropicale]|nr:hypothetical protein CGCTS75_v011972 [Colletotrichum tropicale]